MYNTGNPVPSAALEDMADNAQTFDALVTKTSGTVTDRLGNTRRSFQQIVTDMGFNPVSGSFQAGATITEYNQCLLDETTGTFYSWGGALPKVVAAGSTPATSGGVGALLWVDRTDLTLRSELLAGAITERGSALSLRDFVSIKDFGAAGDGATDDFPELQSASATAVDAPVILAGGNGYYLAGSRVRLQDVQAPLQVEEGSAIKCDVNPAVKEFKLLKATQINGTNTINRKFEQNINVPLSEVYSAIASAMLYDKTQYTRLNLTTDFTQYNLTGIAVLTAGSAVVASEYASWAAQVAAGQEVFLRPPVVGDHIEFTFSQRSNVFQGGFVSVEIIGNSERYSVTFAESSSNCVVISSGGTVLRTVALPSANFGFQTYGSINLSYRLINKNTVEIYSNDIKILELNTLAPTGGAKASSTINYLGFGVSYTLTDTTIVRQSFKYTKKNIRSSKTGSDIIIGDSISYGAWASKDYAYHLQNILSQSKLGGDITIRNEAIPGATTTSWLNGSTYKGFGGTPVSYGLSLVDFSNASYVYVMLGTNDCQTSTSPNTFETNLATIIDYIVAQGCTPIVGIPPVWSSATGTRSQDLPIFAASIKSVCKTKGVTVAEVRSWFGANLDRYYDGLHPHEVGQVGIAAAFAEARLLANPVINTEDIAYPETTPTYTNSWVAYTTGGAIAASYRREGNKVILSGAMSSGTIGAGTPAFTLPPGLRPSGQIWFPVSTYSGSAMVTGSVGINANGEVSVWYATANNIISLSGIEFYV